MQQAAFACPPKVSVQKNPLTVRQGDSTMLTCQVQGSPTPAVHWIKDGKILVTEIPSSIREYSLSISLKMNSTSKSMGGLYTCVASTSAGKVSCSAELSVEGGITQLLKVYF